MTYSKALIRIYIAIFMKFKYLNLNFIHVASYTMLATL